MFYYCRRYPRRHPPYEDDPNSNQHVTPRGQAEANALHQHYQK